MREKCDLGNIIIVKLSFDDGVPSLTNKVSKLLIVNK